MDDAILVVGAADDDEIESLGVGLDLPTEAVIVAAAGAGWTNEERAGAAGADACSESSNFGSHTVASASITVSGHGCKVSVPGKVRMTGADSACNGVIWITAGLAFTCCPGADDRVDEDV